jgi:glucan phosphorylase
VRAALSAGFLRSCIPPQVKRIHEYKRQVLAILFVVSRYRWLKTATPVKEKRNKKGEENLGLAFS